MILGIMPDDRFAQRVLYSRPYYEASYQLVVRSGERFTGRLIEPLAVEDGVAVRGLGGVRCGRIPAPRRFWKPLRRAARRRVT